MIKRGLHILGWAFSLSLLGLSILAWIRSEYLDQSAHVLAIGNLDVSLRIVHGHCALQAFNNTSGIDGNALNWKAILNIPIGADEQSDLEWAISDDRSGTKWNRGGLGFFLAHESVNVGAEEWWLVGPCWFLLIVALFFPAIRLSYLWRRGYRRKLGHCTNCGYDLRANSSGRCPECGTRTPRTQETE